MSINHYERAYLMWNTLIECAAKGEVLSYKKIFELTNIHWRVQKIPLEYIQQYCMEERLPPLTILAVNNSSRLPGSGFIACSPEETKTETQKVFDYDWKSQDNPFSFACNIKDFEEIIEAIKNSNSGKTKIGAIKSRGILQSLLKDASLQIYHNQCAMCKLSIEELLDACHIKPFRDCNENEKKDIKNIIILCKNHHKLLDSHLITIDTNYKMHVSTNIEYKSPADKNLFYQINNVTLNLPSDTKYYPDKQYIKYLNEDN